MGHTGRIRSFRLLFRRIVANHLQDTFGMTSFPVLQCSGVHPVCSPFFLILQCHNWCRGYLSYPGFKFRPGCRLFYFRLCVGFLSPPGKPRYNLKPYRFCVISSSLFSNNSRHWGNSMVPSLSWEVNSQSAAQEVPRLLWAPKVYYPVHKSSAPLESVLSQMISFKKKIIEVWNTRFFVSRIVRLPPNPQVGELPLVGYPCLLIQYIHSWYPSLEAVYCTCNLKTRHFVATRDPLRGAVKFTVKQIWVHLGILPTSWG